MNKISKSIALLFAFGVYGVVYAQEAVPAAETVEAQEPKEGEVREAMLNGQKVKIVRENGEWYMLGKTRGGVSTNDITSVHNPSDMFLDFRGDRLDWRHIDEQVGMLMSINPIKLPREATAEDLAVVIATTKKKYAEALLDGYIENALLASLAKEKGIEVSEEELQTALKAAMKSVPRAKRSEVLKKVSSSDTYFYRNQRNFLLSNKYRDKYLKDTIEVSEEDISAAKEERRAEIELFTGKNSQMPIFLGKMLQELKDGKLDFAEAAFEESDSPDEEDGTWEEFESDNVDEDDEDFTKEMQDFAFNAKRDDLGGVFETEDAYVILKVLETTRNEGSTAPVKVKLARIVKEKFAIPDELTDEAAKALVQKRKLTDKVRELQEELLKEFAPQSAIPNKVSARLKNRQKMRERRKRLLQKAR